MGTVPSRRAVLGGLAGAVASWVASAFGAAPPARQVELFSAWHAARRGGRALLAVVVPEEGRDVRGRVVGAVLDEADDDLLARLAAYVPVCATVEELHLLGVVVPADAWFAVVEATVPAAVRALAGPPLGDDVAEDIDRMTRLLRRHLEAAEMGASAPAAGRAAWVSSAPPGAQWAHHTGCGLAIEHDGFVMLNRCGMGQVPARAARFLRFLDEDR